MTKNCLKSAVLASAVALASCGHAPPSPPLPPSPCTTPEPLRVTLTASPHLNPGESGESLATTVRLYQLKDTGKLIESSLDRILDGDRAVLGEDFVSVQEITLYPGERASPAMVRGEGATSLAVVAFFRRPIGPSWRAIKKLPAPDSQHCHGITPAALAASMMKFTLDDSRVEMR
jgi:type VI secretion system VasD/TssJ family lipoprotein